MKISDIFKHILLRSGQFIMTQSKVELDEDRFVLLVEEALAIYGKHSPIEKHFYIEAHNSRVYTFNEGNTFGLGVPDEISSVTPIRALGVNSLVLRSLMDASHHPNLDERREFPTEYRKPHLYLPVSGEFDVLAIYRHKVVKQYNQDGTISYCVPTITLRDDALIKLIRGMFLESIGRSRRAFTLTDLPITMDADTIASEGREMIDAATEQIHKEAKFYLAFGG